MLHKDASSKLSGSKCTVLYKTIHLHAAMRKINFKFSSLRSAFFVLKPPKNSSSSSCRRRAADSSTNQPPNPCFTKKNNNNKFAANESEFHPAVWSGLRSERWAEICQEDIKKRLQKNANAARRLTDEYPGNRSLTSSPCQICKYVSVVFAA